MSTEREFIHLLGNLSSMTSGKLRMLRKKVKKQADANNGSVSADDILVFVDRLLEINEESVNAIVDRRDELQQAALPESKQTPTETE